MGVVLMEFGIMHFRSCCSSDPLWLFILLTEVYVLAFLHDLQE